MRVAVFADVHADIHALTTLIVDVETHGIVELWCLGDFASGGAHPAECFDLTMRSASIVLAGNHEAFVLGRVWEQLDGSWEGAPWARYARFAFEQLGGERLEQLATLSPHASMPEHGVELVHGSLEDPLFGFVKDGRSARVTLAHATEPIVLLGHTHQAAYFRESAGGELPERMPMRVGDEFTLDGRCVLNPGAGREARHARWLELELDGNQVRAVWHRVPVARDA